jgi:hypothetical protein
VAPAKPTAINSTAADATGLCGGGDFGYSVSTVANATSYTWTPAAGTTVSLNNSDGSLMTLHAPAGFNTGTLSVTANNSCGSSLATTKTLNAAPAKPGAVSGPVNVSASQAGAVYSVPSVGGLTYTWSAPAGAKIVSGQNTSSITVNWGSTSGNITAKASNSCGTSTASILAVTVSAALSSNAGGGIQSAVIALPKAMTIMPNPAKQIAYVTFESAIEYKYSLVVTSLSGQPLQQTNGIAYKGQNKISLDVHNYANGVYMVTLINDKGESKTMKLVKE